MAAESTRRFEQSDKYCEDPITSRQGTGRGLRVIVVQSARWFADLISMPILTTSNLHRWPARLSVPAVLPVCAC